jgi:hypothetical protein
MFAIEPSDYDYKDTIVDLDHPDLKFNNTHEKLMNDEFEMA